MSLLTRAEREKLAADLPEWRMAEGRDALQRSFRFQDFGAAWAFMTRAALAAERMDHHPEWTNIWNRVEVTLSTHDAGGLTGKDVALARAIDAYATPLTMPGR